MGNLMRDASLHLYDLSFTRQHRYHRHAQGWIGVAPGPGMASQVKGLLQIIWIGIDVYIQRSVRRQRDKLRNGGAEVSAVNSVDDREIPCPGPMTSVIASEYAKAVRGQIDKYKEWCEHVG